MRIVLNRLDERLIHGQILISYVKKLSAKQILIVDDSLANDSLMRNVLQATLPRKVGVRILTVQQAAEYIRLEQDDCGERILVLYKDPRTVFELFQKGYHMPTLNIGFLAAGPKRRKLTEFVYMSEEEMGWLKALMESGVDIYIQIANAESSIALKELIE